MEHAALQRQRSRCPARPSVVVQITFAPPRSRGRPYSRQAVRPGSDRPDRILLKLSKCAHQLFDDCSTQASPERVQMITRSQRLQGLELLENGVQNQELVPNDHYVEKQNITNADWRTNCYEYYPDGRIKRCRGPTKLANIENLPEGVKIIVKLDRFNIPCSQSAIVLGSYLGTLVRKPHLAPLNILQWNHKLYKRAYHPKMISEVELDGKWRQYKSKLKRGYYKPNLPMERVLQTVPKIVAKSQWATLVSYWYLEDSKNEVYMKLAEKRVDCQELSEADFEQAMLEVLGKDHRGRVRGMGPTITPTNYYGRRFLNISGSNEGNGSSNVNGFISFIVSYLTEKYPEDNLISRLPPSVARVIPRQEVDQNEGSQPPNTATSSLPFDQNHENQLPNTTPSSSARASSQSCSEEE
uniref:Uncharacterized protein n=2 Tax=Oryza sativa subsp. japonica TaxID=39947 RepID=Q2QNB2_ORYSJ|nr:hypothetical protein LOC_Os12g38410 [Oryza sativa Japonica Group]